MQEFKNTTKEIKLLPYNKPSENKAVEVDRFRNVLDSKPLQELQSLRNNLSAILTPILNKDITNISSGITAQVSKTSIKKMGSDKAVNKSIENGFSLQQHFKASADIENLYKNATKKATTKDLKNGDPAIQIHTFISQVNDNANAKILVKESLDKDSRRIYTLELESLESTKPLAQVPNGDLADHLTKSKQKSDTSLTPLENVSEIIPQTAPKEQINNTLDDTADTLFWIWSDFANELDTLSKKAYYDIDFKNIQNLASGLRLYGDYDDVLNDIKADIFQRYINNDTMGKYHILTPHPNSKKPKEFLEKLNIRFTDKKIEKEVKSLFKQATEKEAELLNKANKDLQELFQQRDMPTQKELSKESKSTQEPVTQKETTRASGEKSSNESLTQAKEYTNLIDDFLYQYDLKDDLWFMKHAKLEYSDNGEEVYAALKHLNEVRDNVSIKYDDYVAATEQVKNSLNRAALDIIDDFKACDEALEAIEKIQTKLLDDYPFTQSQKHR
ncbi:hypothetical protein [Helicobacter bilis]|uniref:LPD3 domain-containing protein n=1 Tax=Helicobacter bilis TaxID=37372 RepID=UPI0009843888|nr:hypothetical protein [Helicobacter bilis]